MADSVMDVAALDSAATAVESSTQDTVETTPDASIDTPAVETDSGTDKTENRSADDKSATVADASAPITPAKIAQALHELNSKDPAMARALIAEVKYNSEAKRLLKELAPEARTLAE